jgi:Uma2 family endonuclease
VFDAAPQGTAHDGSIEYARDALREYFRKRGRSVFLARNLRALYPGEPAFDPDLLAVLDVEKPENPDLSAWICAEEKRGIDFALEIHVAGDREKDAVRNVERYARLGIPEYFLFDWPAHRLFGWRLLRRGKPYQRLVPQKGSLRSTVLDLDLRVVNGRLRFFAGTAELPGASELIARLDKLFTEMEESLGTRDQTIAKITEERDIERRLREDEQRKREDERRRREEAERELAQLRTTLKKLRGE